MLNPIIQDYEFDKLIKWRYSPKQKFCFAYYLPAKEAGNIDLIREIFQKQLETHPRMNATFSEEEYVLIPEYLELMKNEERAIALITPVWHYTHAYGRWPNSTSRWLYHKDNELNQHFVELSRYDYRNTLHKVEGADDGNVNCGVARAIDDWSYQCIVKKH